MKIRYEEGIYIEGEGISIAMDASKMPRSQMALVTHAHWDHCKAFWFDGLPKASTKATLEFVKVSGRSISRWTRIEIGQSLEVGDFRIKAHNAGHILGSVQYDLRSGDYEVVYTGDLNLEDTLISRAAQPISCDILLIEATYGHPSHARPPREAVINAIVEWSIQIIRKGLIPVLYADSLGNSQELISIFNRYTRIPVVVHEKIAKLSCIYKAHGFPLEFFDMGDFGEEELNRCDHILLMPKGAKLKLTRRHKPALVSGWGDIGGFGMETFPLSDHADFGSLMGYVEESSPDLVLTVHGGAYDRVLAKAIESSLGIRARPLNTGPWDSER
ncbi:MAG: MBL fold metallo-hydrolase [Candidatus Bathyarchaeia archaeon]